MNRAFARPIAGVALATLLLFLAVPNASAGPLGSSPTAPREQADWKIAAWAWLSEIWGSNQGTGVALASPQATGNPGMTRSIGKNGSCIDPLGIDPWGIICIQVTKPPGIILGPPHPVPAY